MKYAIRKFKQTAVSVWEKLNSFTKNNIISWVVLGLLSPVVLIVAFVYFIAVTPFGRGAINFIKKLWSNTKGRRGIIMVGAIVLVGLLAPLITINNPNDITNGIFSMYLPPFATSTLNGASYFHLLGTDAFGFDVWSKVAYGAQVSLKVGVLTAFGVAIMGATLGLIAGYFGGWAETIIMRIVDILLTIPSLPLMMMVAAIFGDAYNINVLIFMFIIFGWCGTARIIRSVVLSLKQTNYIKAAELAGAKGGYIMFRHILPGVSNLLIMSTATSSAGFMVAEAGLSFIGLGDPNAISWGKLIVEAQSSALIPGGPWWLIIIPGLAIFYAVMSFMQLGLACEEIFNPRMGSVNKSYKLFKKLQSNEVDDVFAQMDIEGDETPNNVRKPVSNDRGAK